VTPVEPAASGPSVAARVRRFGRVPAFDGLRGVAVLMVLTSHLWIVLPGQTGAAIIDGLFDGGFLGVDIFFVLSGFLITALLLREQLDHPRVRFGSFYARRALRLLPALFVLLAVHMVYVAIAEPYTLAREFANARAAVLYYANYYVVWHFFDAVGDLGHLWSLSVEEQFYLVWPAILILFLGIRRPAGYVATLLGVMIAVVAIRRAVLWEGGTGWLPLFNRTDTRIDSLLVGALLASLWVRGRTPTKGLAPAAWIASGILLLCVEFARGDEAFVFLGGFTLVAVIVAVLILATIDSDWPGNRVLALAPLVAVGRVSYGLYLWHVPVFWAVSRWGSTWSDGARVVVALGATAVLTVLSWFLIERPALHWKRRFERKPV